MQLIEGSLWDILPLEKQLDFVEKQGCDLHFWTITGPRTALPLLPNFSSLLGRHKLCKGDESTELLSSTVEETVVIERFR
jgi:hypothetical protein